MHINSLIQTILPPPALPPFLSLPPTHFRKVTDTVQCQNEGPHLLLLVELSRLRCCGLSSQQCQHLRTIIRPTCQVKKLRPDLNHLAKVMLTRGRTRFWPDLPVEPAAPLWPWLLRWDTQQPDGRQNPRPGGVPAPLHLLNVVGLAEPSLSFSGRPTSQVPVLVFIPQPCDHQVMTLVAQMVRRLPTMWETQARSLGREDPLEKEASLTAPPPSVSSDKGV